MSYEGSGLSIELSEVPRSRAPSHISSQSLFATDDDEDPLIKGTGPRSLRASGRLGDSPSHKAGHSTDSVNKQKKRRLSGWRFGVAASALLAFVVLLANVLFVMIASTKYTVDGSIGTLYDGDCHHVEKATIWFHVGINVLSSLLLSASNYTMQALCSPTRKEIDRAHAKGDWVDIGSPSVRNIFGRISWKRTVLWWVLGLSSVPIHLLYGTSSPQNSAVFKTIDANLYEMTVVNERFLDADLFELNVTMAGTGEIPFQSRRELGPLRRKQQWFIENHQGAKVTQLSNQECISAYGMSFVSGYGDLLAVTSDRGEVENQSVFWAPKWYLYGGDQILYNWICTDMPDFGPRNSYTCDVPTALKQADQWTLKNHTIDYCLARVSPSHCKLQFSQSILITVIVMNFAKAAVMLWTYLFQKSLTLVTLGDAIASFLGCPDPLTTSRCLMTKSDVGYGPLQWRSSDNATEAAKARTHPVNGIYTPVLGELDPDAAWAVGWNARSSGAKYRPRTQPRPQVYSGNARHRWYRAASVKRWLTTTLLITFALMAVAVLLNQATTNNTKLNGSEDPFRLGFGKIDPRLIIETYNNLTGASGLLAAVLLANLPQAICSFLYLAYNGLFTCMLLSDEWSRYFLRPKPLRVTTPHGQQRSKHYLQLPFVYSVPLLAASALLHWLISESIFLARVDYYKEGRYLKLQSTSETGFSPLAILLALLLGVVMLIVLVGHGFRRFKSPMPVVSSCSVAIASACHPPKDDEDAAYLPVAWGDINAEGSGEVGHCSFTSREVYEPVEGRLYAGAVNRDNAKEVRRRDTRT